MAPRVVSSGAGHHQMFWSSGSDDMPNIKQRTKKGPSPGRNIGHWRAI